MAALSSREMPSPKPLLRSVQFGRALTGLVAAGLLLRPCAQLSSQGNALECNPKGFARYGAGGQ